MDFARALGQTREMLPVVQRYINTTYHALEELQHSEALQLRRIEDLPSFADYVSRLSDQLDAFASELGNMPRSAVAAAAVLALRLVATLNTIVDAAIDEMLNGHTTLSRIGLVVAAVPGWLAVVYYRNVLLKDLPPAGEKGGNSSALVTRLQSAEVFVRNARCLPPAFWLATTMSGAVALQAARQFTARAIRGVLRTRLRLLLALGAAYMVVSRGGKERVIDVVARKMRQLSPAIPQALASAMHAQQEAFQSAGEAVGTLCETRKTCFFSPSSRRRASASPTSGLSNVGNNGSHGPAATAATNTVADVPHGNQAARAQ